MANSDTIPSCPKSGSVGLTLKGKKKKTIWSFQKSPYLKCIGTCLWVKKDFYITELSHVLHPHLCLVLRRGFWEQLWECPVQKQLGRAWLVGGVFSWPFNLISSSSHFKELSLAHKIFCRKGISLKSSLWADSQLKSTLIHSSQLSNNLNFNCSSQNFTFLGGLTQKEMTWYGKFGFMYTRRVANSLTLYSGAWGKNWVLYLP